MTGLSIGAGRILARSAPCRVHSVFARAAHLEVGNRLVLVAPGPRGPGAGCPFGVAVPARPWAVFADHVRDLIEEPDGGRQLRWCATSRRVLNGLPGHSPDVVLDLSQARTGPERTWRAPRIATVPSGALCALQSDSGTTGLDDEPGIRRRLDAAAEAAFGREAPDALAWFVGRGPGLTPSGDDVIVGLVAAVAGLGTVPVSTLDWLRLTYAEPAATTEVAREYVRQATEGLFARDIVNVLNAVARSVAAVPAAARQLRRHGHTSGADTLLGLRVGLAHHASRCVGTESREEHAA